jgi:chromosome segregation protein
MPLRLKQLELHGYKTFATKTEFLFSDGISAIVGPNGSGKSNILDGIRWVLGEQSFGLLRGKKTEDMIFAGSELRPRAGMAQATLTFDNADGWLPIDFSEVSIARRAYRDGENEYLLNGQRVRLRDLGELLAKCGLAERTYTIIGQGLIDTALSLKAEERRALFEEAAGIGVYRNKREDALRKLDATQRNHERVLDILAEIKPRLRSLERQAQRARDFNVVKDDLHAMLKLWYGYHWHRAVAELEQAQVAADAAATELSVHQTQQEGFDQEVAALRARLAALRSQLQIQRQEASRLHSEGESLARELAVADERLRSLAAQREALLAELPPLEAQSADQAERAAAASVEAARLAAEAEEAQRQAEAAQAAMADVESQRGALRQREAEARAALHQVEARLSEARARQAGLQERLERLAASQVEQQTLLAQLQAAEAEARRRLAEASAALSARQTARAGAEANVTAQAEALRAAEAALLTLTQGAAAARADEQRLLARQDVLDRARAELVGFSAGARALLSERFPARGVLAEMLAHSVLVPAGLEAAVSAALGASLEALVVDDLEAVEAAIQALGDAHGRAALLPEQHLQPPAPLTPPDDPDCLGVASELLQADGSLRSIVNALLGQTLVVRDRASARRLIQSAIHNLQSATLVTLSGEVYHPSGLVLAGREAAPTMLEQARERRDLSAEIQAARARMARQDNERERAGQAVAEARAALEEAQAELRSAQAAERRAGIARDAAALEAERAAHEVQFRREQLAALAAEAAQIHQQVESVDGELTRWATQHQSVETEVAAASQAVAGSSAEELSARLARWQTAAAVAARAVQDAQTRAAELERARAAAETLLADRRYKAEKLASEAQAVAGSVAASRHRHAELSAEVSTYQLLITPSESQLAELEAEQTRVEAGDTIARAALHAAERQHAQAQLELTRKTEELDAMRRRIEEDFGLVELDYGEAATGPTPLPLYPIVEKLEPMETLPEELEEQLNRKRGQLRRMGLINPDAEREYDEVKERHGFLSTQVSDLESAQTQLREVIAEMDVLMERDFRTTFDAVANEFRETFSRLFGGGSAKLILTDPDHLSTSGVDIQARLPGRRPQSLAMLSGGERSLTACALIFALLRVSPTPFCVLDEVDAMLDEANVGRYREMLTELSEKTQFIIITHNRNTVQAAHTVYGITMGADSASQAISLKLDGDDARVREREP